MKRKTILFYISLSLCVLNWACKPYTEKEDTSDGTPVDCTYSLPNLAKINQFILANPDDGKLYRIRSQILLDSGQNIEALSDAKRALSLNPEDLYNFVVVAKAHRALGHVDSALSACFTAEKQGLDDPDNNLLQGDLYLILREYTKSLEYLNRALKQAPFEPKIYFLKGVVYWEKNDTISALSSWQTAIEQDASFGDGYARLASYYIDKKEFSIAEQYLRSGLRLRPNDAILHFDMGVFLNNKGFADSAIASYEKAISLDRKLLLAQQNLGYLKFNKRLYAESILLFEGCLPTEPKNSTLAYFLGLSYQYSGELEKAKIELERVVNLDKDFVKEAQKGLISLQKQIALKAKEKPHEVEPVQ